jgi:ABC-type nitrate/sulfonate/bicarbonate transport system substrate-binding protein
MTRKSVLAAFVVALLSLLVSGCDRKPQPPLVFGAAIWPGYEPVYLANKLGYYSKANLRLAEYTRESEVEQAFRNHSIQVAALTLEQALLLRRDIPQTKIILLFDKAGDRMDVLVTRNDSLGEYRQEMKQLLQGWRRALEYMDKAPVKAVQIMAQREHISPEKFTGALEGMDLYGWQRNQQMMIGEPPPAGNSIIATQRAMLSSGKLNIGIDPSMLLDPTLLVQTAK